MRAPASVSIHDYFSARQARIPLRPADFETARRVDVNFCVFVEKFRGDHFVHHVFFDILAQLFLRHLPVVLGGNDHRIDAHGTLVVVFHGHLRLSVGTKIGQKSAFAHLRQAHGKLMGQGDGQGHQLLRLTAGIAEHHALIARAERILRRARVLSVHPHRNVGDCSCMATTILHLS